MSNTTLDLRVKHLESEFDNMHVRVDTHERALFGGFDPETNQRHIGVLERLGEVVSELEKITEAMGNANKALKDAGRLVITWVGRITCALVIGVFTVIWFFLTHWNAFSKAFASSSQ